MTEIWLERRKWPDRPHYGHAGWIIGEDENGVWIELRIGSPVYRGPELLFHGAAGGLMCAPRAGGWLAWFPEVADFELYVDIVTGITHAPGSITMVDLDFDVIRYRTGEVRLLDEDEFEQHRVELSYPQPVVDAARADAALVLEAVRKGDEPFAGGTAARWAQRIAR
jgi:hypothetical protein